MKSIVILEGPDGAGKTTLAQTLRRQLDAVYIHHGSYATLRGDQIAQLYHQSIEPALTDSANVVLDRSWLSEPIYGEVFRSGLNRTAPWHRMLDRCLMSVPHLSVYLTADLDTLWSTVGERPSVEMAKRREQLERVFLGYERSYDAWCGNKLCLPRAGRGVDELADLVLKSLINFGPLARQTKLHDLGVIGNVCGTAPMKTALLVGDAPSKKSTTNLPFVNHTLGGCSAWFAWYLKQQGVDEQRLTWVNAWQSDDTPTDLDAVYSIMRGAPVFALGQVAARDLRTYNVPFTEVEHPQFMKRFRYDHAHEEWLLGEKIKEALA